MSPLNITQPLGIWSIMATIRWCPIYPKWDIYQPLFSATKTGMVSRDVTIRLSHPKVWCGSWLLGLSQLQRYLYMAKGPHCTKLRSVHSSGVATCDVPSTLHSGHGKCSRSSAPCHQVRDAWALRSLHTAHLLCEVPGERDYRPQVWLWLWWW